MGQILSTLSNSPMINQIPIDSMPNHKELSRVTTKYAEHQVQQEPKPMKKIGFKINDKDDLIKNILDNVEKSGDKLPPKTSLINIKNRRHKTIYEKTMKDLKGMGVVEYKRGSGYYMAIDKDVAQREIFEAYN
jgi:DNA-binding GntR family transcriptional regulator